MISDLEASHIWYRIPLNDGKQNLLENPSNVKLSGITTPLGIPFSGLLVPSSLELKQMNIRALVFSSLLPSWHWDVSMTVCRHGKSASWSQRVTRSEGKGEMLSKHPAQPSHDHLKDCFPKNTLWLLSNLILMKLVLPMCLSLANYH